MLRGLVHLRDGFAQLRHPAGLFVAGRTDFTDQVAHSSDRAHNLGHGGAGLIDQHGSLLNALHAGVNEVLDFLGSIRTASRKRANFTGHYGKSASLLSRPCSFHGGIQRQDIGLKGDAINDADDVGNFPGGVVDALHGLDHAADHLTTAHRNGGGIGRQLIGLTRTVGVVPDRVAKCRHGCIRAFQNTGLGLGAVGQIHIPGRNFCTGRRDGIGTLPDLGNHR